MISLLFLFMKFAAIFFVGLLLLAGLGWILFAIMVYRDKQYLKFVAENQKEEESP